jgi:beta-glucosidase
MGWGSGSVEFPYLIAPLEAIKAQAQKDGTSITSSPNDNAQQGASAAQNADIAVVCINSDAGEGYITVEGVAGKSSGSVRFASESYIDFELQETGTT